MATKETNLALKSPTSIAWWVQVTETPEETKRIVFRKGIPLGSNTLTPTGGHTPPNSTAGASAKWRYPQNIPKKKKHSDRMNSTIPTLKPTVTS